MSALAPTLQAFFTERLTRQLQASPHTIAAYRDALKLLLSFAARQTGKAPSALDVADLDADLITAFLDHLQQQRGNSGTTRNARLAAIRSLFRFAALRHPEHAASVQRVLAIPLKRAGRSPISYLTEEEIDAFLAAPDTTTRTGRRDHALLALAVQTGLRASELIGLRCRDVHLAAGAYVACHGKGRKDRITPLTRDAVAVLRAWLAERAGQPDEPLFPSRRGTPLSRDALERRLALYHRRAAQTCPTLKGKKFTAHTLRHSAAMRLLHAGIDTSVIALWMGHERVDTTQVYLHADLKLKETRPQPHDITRHRAQPLSAARCDPRLPRRPIATCEAPLPVCAASQSRRHRPAPSWSDPAPHTPTGEGLPRRGALAPRGGPGLSQRSWRALSPAGSGT